MHGVDVRECSSGSLLATSSMSILRNVGSNGWYSSCFTPANLTENERSFIEAIASDRCNALEQLARTYVIRGTVTSEIRYS